MMLTRLLALSVELQPSDETSNELQVSFFLQEIEFKPYKKSLNRPLSSAAA